MWSRTKTFTTVLPKNIQEFKIIVQKMIIFHQVVFPLMKAKFNIIGILSIPQIPLIVSWCAANRKSLRNTVLNHYAILNFPQEND